MLILRWLWEGSGNGLVPPSVVFWTLRVLMFILSFVLEDWAIHELIESPRQRRIAVLLVASSYVTWTWQVHTFSNAIETLLVLWSLVLMKRIVEHKHERSTLVAPGILGFLLVFGTFNRITFPAYLLVPGLQLIPVLLKKPSPLIVLTIVGILTTTLAVIVDTSFYHEGHLTLSQLLHTPTITPLNNLRYNTQPSNLELHGRHPFYQHFLVNLPQLLGPAFLLLITHPRQTPALLSAISGIAVLSLFPHQEARFLLPAVPLTLSSIKLPSRYTRTWMGFWIAFNVVLALLMGLYHQGGIVPAQNYLESQYKISQAFWWKTYSPPTWLLDGRNENMTTIDLMGLKRAELQGSVCQNSTRTSIFGKSGVPGEIVLVAPNSATYLDDFQIKPTQSSDMHLSKLWSHRNHMNLDDMEFGDDGVLPTLQRVVGRRGLNIWAVHCPDHL